MTTHTIPIAITPLMIPPVMKRRFIFLNGSKTANAASDKMC